MRRDHRPFWIKQLLAKINQWYCHRYVRPHFDQLAEGARFLAPRSLQIHGPNISAGRYLHLISSPHKPVKVTTWGDKSHQGSISIGDYCLIAPGVELASMCGINIGDNCMIATEVLIHDSDWHGLYNRLRPFRCSEKVTLANNVWIGARSIITKGVSIGENSVIGAGSVVTKDIPANCVAAGNPAKVVKVLNPNRRTLTRAYLFRDGDRYWDQQREIDAYFTLDNSTTHWLRTLAAPSPYD